MAEPYLPEGSNPAMVRVMHGPAGSGIEPLPLIFDGESFISHWRLSFAERQAILDGANIKLSVLGSMHPPVAILVEGVRDAEEEPGLAS